MLILTVPRKCLCSLVHIWNIQTPVYMGLEDSFDASRCFSADPAVLLLLGSRVTKVCDTGKA